MYTGQLMSLLKFPPCFVGKYQVLFQIDYLDFYSIMSTIFILIALKMCKIKNEYIWLLKIFKVAECILNKLYLYK